MDRRKSLVLIGLGVVAVVAAWINGGEQSTRPVTYEIAVPEHVR